MHLDLKPENILYISKDSNRIKLIDFFHAQSIHGNEPIKVLGHPLPSAVDMEESKIVGTPYYMAPEMIKQEYDQQADMWSIGCIVYLMLTGMPPFNAKEDAEVLFKVSIGKYSETTLKECHVSNNAIDFIS